jgi:hypothetical protein
MHTVQDEAAELNADLLVRLDGIVADCGYGETAVACGWSRMKLWRMLHGRTPMTTAELLLLLQWTKTDLSDLAANLGW